MLSSSCGCVPRAAATSIVSLALLAAVFESRRLMLYFDGASDSVIADDAIGPAGVTEVSSVTAIVGGGAADIAGGESVGEDDESSSTHLFRLLSAPLGGAHDSGLAGGGHLGGGMPAGRDVGTIGLFYVLTGGLLGFSYDLIHNQVRAPP